MVETKFILIGCFCAFVVWPAIIVSLWMWNVHLAKRHIKSWNADRSLYFVFVAGRFGAQIKAETNKFIHLDDAEWAIFRRYQIYFQLELIAAGILTFGLLNIL